MKPYKLRNPPIFWFFAQVSGIVYADWTVPELPPISSAARGSHDPTRGAARGVGVPASDALRGGRGPTIQ
jgi:hypothetical protein